MRYVKILISALFLIFLASYPSSCQRFIPEKTLGEESFEIAMYPILSYMAMQNVDSINNSGKIYQDIKVLISEKDSLLYIKPFYQTIEELDPIIFNIKLAIKNGSGLVFGIFDANKERVGYMTIRNGRSLIMDVQLISNTIDSFFELTVVCHDPFETSKLTEEDYDLLSQY